MLIYFLRPFYYYLCVIQHILVCTILALCTLEQMQTPALGCNFYATGDECNKYDEALVDKNIICTCVNNLCVYINIIN